MGRNIYFQLASRRNIGGDAGMDGNEGGQLQDADHVRTGAPRRVRLCAHSPEKSNFKKSTSKYSYQVFLKLEDKRVL